MANYGTYGMPTPALKPKKRQTGSTPTRLTQALASGQGARTAFANPYESNDQAHFGTNYGPLTAPSLPTYTPPAPLGTPQNYAPQQAVAPQAPEGMSFDLETDPVLQQMHAMAANQRAQAESGALKLRKQLAIDYGDPTFGASIDEATGQAAAQNPFSALATLKTGYDRNMTNMEEDLNSHNLFYGGTRIKALGDAAHDYQGQQANLAGQQQQALGGIDANRIAALMQADQQEQAAYADAYNRALQFALANMRTSGGGGGYDGGGGAPVAQPTNDMSGLPPGGGVPPQQIANLLWYPTGAVRDVRRGGGYY